MSYSIENKYNTDLLSSFSVYTISLTIVFFVGHSHVAANIGTSNLYFHIFNFVIFITCVISFCFILYFGSLMCGYSLGFLNLFSLVGLILFIVLYFTFYYSFQVVHCAVAADTNMPSAEVLLENDLKEMKVNKNDTFFSYRNIGIVVVSIIVVSFFAWGGGGGDKGSELLSAVGQLGPVEDVLPIVAAVAPIVAVAPAVVDIVIDNTSSTFVMSSASMGIVNLNLTGLEVSIELQERVLSRSVDYYPNFMSALQHSTVQNALVYLLTEDSLGNSSNLFSRLSSILRGSSDNATELLTQYSNVFHIDLLALALVAVNVSVGALALIQDCIPIVSILAYTAFIVMQDDMIIPALVNGNGYEVLASCLFETIPWCLASNMITSSNGINGMQDFVRILGGLYLPADDSFLVSSLDVFTSRLEERTNSGARIVVNDAYILVTLLSDILKEFIDNGINLLFEDYSESD